jgi:hypothetical protein
MKVRLAAVIFIILYLGASTAAFGGPVPPNWKNWDAYPKGVKAPRYTAERIQDMLLAGEKMVFIYAGYDTNSIVCGSIFLPYTLVPPFGDGSKVSLNIPKDTWMVAY